MKAFVFTEHKKLQMQDVDTPSAPEGGALAKVRFSSICGTDLRTYKNGNAHLVPPRIIGHEALYELVEVSPSRQADFHAGDRVIVAPAIGCGHCRSCMSGKTNMCTELRTIGFEYDGTFAQHCAIPEQAFRMNNVIKVENSIEDQAACVAEPIACAINGQSFLGIKPHENVLIFGAGFLGCVHAELAGIQGAEHVIIAEISTSRRQQVQKSLPRVHTLDPTDHTFTQVIEDITAGNGIDVVITACPVGQTHTQALEIVNRSGRISLFGGLSGDGKGFLDSNLIHYKEVSVFGVHASTPLQNQQALKLIEEGKIPVGKYLAQFPFMDIEMAFQSLMTEAAVKAVLKF